MQHCRQQPARVVLAGELQDAVNAIRLLESRHVLTFDADEKEELDKVLAARQTHLAQTLSQCAAQANAPEQAAACATLQQALQAYAATPPKLLDLSRVGMAALSDARADLIGPWHSAYARVSAPLAQLVTLNSAEAQRFMTRPRAPPCAPEPG